MKHSVILACVTFVALASGCVKMRVAQFSPDAPEVDVWVDGKRVLENVGFKQVSDYVKVPKGECEVQFSPAGKTEPLVLDATVKFENGQMYTLATTGLLGQKDLQAMLLSDQKKASKGKAMVRFVHAAPDAPAVDVAVKGGEVLFAGIPFRASSEYLVVEAGTYDLELRPAGKTEVALALPGITFQAKKVYTVYAVALMKDNALAALAVLDGSTPKDEDD